MTRVTGGCSRQAERKEEGGPKPAVIGGYLFASCVGSATFQNFRVNAVDGLVGADVAAKLLAYSDDASSGLLFAS
jgi:hypothetical protein